MIELDEHEGSYLEICKHYRAIYQTPQVKEEKDKMKEVSTVTFGLFSSEDSRGHHIDESFAPTCLATSQVATF